MVGRRSKNKLTHSRARYPNRRSTSSEIDKNLEQVLASLAHLLVASGYGFHNAMRMAKRAFIHAARNVEGNSKRISIARIAATTGLTRIEVSRILRTSDQNVDPRPQNRVAQVVQGWLTDSRYSKGSRASHALPYEGKTRSFTALVKTYSGDIPARAMLREMVRLGIVREESGGIVRLVRSESRIPRAAIHAMRAISPWVNQISLFGHAAQGTKLTSSTNHIRLHFDSIPQLLAAVRLLDDKKAAFLAGISELGGFPISRGKYPMEVTVAIAAAKPAEAAARNRKRKR